MEEKNYLKCTLLTLIAFTTCAIVINTVETLKFNYLMLNYEIALH